MTQLLHINDNNLLIQSGAEVSRNQGYAWLKGDDVVFDSSPDNSPVKHCRLAPQEINSRYWMQCDQSAINANKAGMRHAADLIWRHLKDLRDQYHLEDIVLVAPSHYRESNLQLLLGVAKSCGLSVSGLVNKAVLALHDQLDVEGEYVHIDVQLHQTVLSRVVRHESRVSLSGSDVIQEVGIHLIQEALLKGLQKRFIQKDRFDPLHDAGTEQQLFDQLPQIAQQITQDAKATIGVQHQGRLHGVSIDAKDWHALLSPFTDSLLSAAGKANIQNAFMDLNAAFGAAVPEPLRASKIVMVKEARRVPLELLSRLHGDGVVYLTELPSVGRPSDKTTANSVQRQINTASTQNSNAELAATHLLFGGKAISIADAEIVTEANHLSVRRGLSNVAELLDSGRLFVMNDEGRRLLQPNDRLGSHMADGVITVIQVM